ncbi:protein hokC, partial [Escherichia coli]
FAPLIAIFSPAVVGAVETKKALCELHTRTGQRGVGFSTAYEPE